MVARTRAGGIGSRVFAVVGAVVVGWIALVLVLLGLGALLPGLGLLGAAGTAVAATTAAPSLVIGLLAVGGALLVRRRFRRTGTVLGVAGGVGTAMALVIVVGFWIAAAGAGATVNPFRALVPTSPFGDGPDEHPVYSRTASGQDLHAAVYRPATPNAPLMVYAHGGGWVEGSELDRDRDMRWFADRGWLVVSVEYTLASETVHTWDTAGPQLACALIWAAERAPAWGGDPTRIALLGDSAGGQLATTLAYQAAEGSARSSCGGAVPRVAALAVQYPAVDPVGAYDNGFSIGDDPKLDTRFLGRAYTGGTPAEVPDRYRSITGTTVLPPTAPPTLVISPDDDSVVPPSGVRDFADRASEAGIDVTLVRLPFANHAYDTGATGSLGNQARLTITENWLRDHLR